MPKRKSVRRGRKANSEVLWMGWHKFGGFTPWGWGCTRRTARDRMLKHDEHKDGDFELFRVRITEILPKKSARKGRK